MIKPFIPLEDYIRDNPLVNHSSREIPLWQKGKAPYGLTIPEEQLYCGGLVLGMTKINVLTLMNTGIKPLHIENIMLTGSGYTLPTELPKIIYPNRSVELPITLLATEYGLLPAILRIDAGIGGVYQFRLLARGIWDHTLAVTGMLNSLWEFLQRSVQPAIISNGPKLSVSNTSIEFVGTINVGETSDIRTLIISNAGNEPLTIDNLSVSGEFEIVP